MKLNVFSVYDKAVGAYLQPFFARSKGEAVRSFTDAANSNDHNFHRHSMDYVLMYLGEFDDISSVFICGEPVRILAAHECIADEPFLEENKVAPNGKDAKRIPM